MRQIFPLFAIAGLAACSQVSDVEVVRHAFDAAAHKDAPAFARFVAPGATYTILDGRPRALKPADLVVTSPCRIERFHAVAAAKVAVEGQCEVHGNARGKPYRISWPLRFNVDVDDRRIVRVNRLVFPM